MENKPEFNKVGSPIILNAQSDGKIANGQFWDAEFSGTKGILSSEISLSGVDGFDNVQSLLTNLLAAKDVPGSIAQKIEALREVIFGGTPAEAFDALKKISDELEKDNTAEAAILKAIAANQADFNKYTADHAQESATAAAAVEAARIAEAAKVEKDRAARAEAILNEETKYRSDLAEETKSAAAAILKEETEYRSNLAEETKAAAAAILKEETEYRSNLAEETATTAADVEKLRVQRAEEVEAARIAEAAKVEKDRAARAADVLKEETEFRSNLAALRASEAKAFEAYKSEISEEQKAQDDAHSTLAASHQSLKEFTERVLDLDNDKDDVIDTLTQFFALVQSADEQDQAGIAAAVKSAAADNVALKAEFQADLDTTNAQVAGNKKELDAQLLETNNNIAANHAAQTKAITTVQENLNAVEATALSGRQANAQALASYQGEQAKAAADIAAETKAFRDADVKYKADLDANRAAEAKAFAQHVANFEEEKKATKTDRDSLRADIATLVNDTSTAAADSIKEILDELSKNTKKNIEEIYDKTVAFVKTKEIVTPSIPVWEGTLQVTVNGVQYFEGDFAASYTDGRLVEINIGDELDAIIESDGSNLKLYGRCGEYTDTSFSLEYPRVSEDDLS